MEEDKKAIYKIYIDDFINKYNFSSIINNTLPLASYMELLVEKNKMINLTGKSNFDEICETQLRESLELFHALPSSMIDQNHMKVLDIGSGGGFPGIVTAIVKKNWDIVLVESITKKANFLLETVQKLSLTNVKVLNVRAEELLNPGNHNYFDIVMARAVGKIDYLYPLFSYFSKEKGLMVFWKKRIEFSSCLKKYPITLQKEHLYPVENGFKSIVVFSK